MREDLTTSRPGCQRWCRSSAVPREF